MTNDHPANTPDPEESLRVRLSRPMPLQAQRELHACDCIDQLAEALTQTRAALEAAVSAAAVMSTKAPASVVQAGWKASLAELTIMVDGADLHGRATIRAVKAMLAIE